MAVDNEASSTSYHLTTPANSWKMTRYMRGVSVPGFASFLGSVGLVNSLKIILDAVNLLVLEPEFEYFPRTLFSLFTIPWRYHINSAILVVGIFELLLNIGMFAFSFKLWKKVSDNDLVGIRSLVKIGCYIMAGLELLVCTLIGLIISTIVAWLPRLPGALIFILTVFSISTISSAVFTCLLIVGVRKVMSGVVNANIIYKITFFILFVIFAFTIAFTIPVGAKDRMNVVNMFLYIFWMIIYSSSFTVLHYNIMLHDQQRYETFELEERNNLPTNWEQRRSSTCLTYDKVS